MLLVHQELVTVGVWNEASTVAPPPPPKRAERIEEAPHSTGASGSSRPHMPMDDYPSAPQKIVFSGLVQGTEQEFRRIDRARARKAGSCKQPVRVRSPDSSSCKMSASRSTHIGMLLQMLEKQGQQRAKNL